MSSDRFNDSIFDAHFDSSAIQWGPTHEIRGDGTPAEQTQRARDESRAAGRTEDSVQTALHGHSIQNFWDPTDAYANLHAATIQISPVITQASRGFAHELGTTAVFKAYITAFNETYACDWDSQAVFGRTDPIYMFKQTTRSVTLSFKVVAASSGEAYHNLGRIQKLIHTLYPAYHQVGSATTIAQSPLVRLRILNLTPSIGDAGNRGPYATGNRGSANIGRGTLAAIQSVSIAHNIENLEGGVYQDTNTSYIPRFVEVSIEFDAIHEASLGWEKNSEGKMAFSQPNAPYGVDLETTFNHRENRNFQRPGTGFTAGDPRADQSQYSGARHGYGVLRPESDDASLYSPDTEAAQAALAERQNDAMRAEAEARYGGLFGGLIARSDARQIEGITGEGRRERLAERSQSLFDRSFSANPRRGERMSSRAGRYLDAAASEMERLQHKENLQEFIDG